MTLIAGYRAYGYPFLVGDFVTSVSGKRFGLKRKVLKVGLNCAIGWTGSLLAAEQICRLLRARFKDRGINKSDLQDALTSFNTSALGALEVQIIGWIIDQEEDCFTWWSSCPEKIFYCEPAFGGSGAQIMERMCGPSELHDESNPNLVDLGLAIDTTLSITTNLMKMEILDYSNLTFGHAYEVLYFENGEFRYVDNILYSAVVVDMDERHNISKVTFAPTVYKYRVFDEYCVTEKYDDRVKATEMQVISPIGVSESADPVALYRSLVSDPYRFPIHSKFYGVFVVFKAIGFESPPFALIHPADVRPEAKIIDIEDDALTINAVPLKWMYDTIRQDMHRL